MSYQKQLDQFDGVAQYGQLSMEKIGAKGPASLGGVMQKFPTGATRSASDGKNDYEGFVSFPVLEEFGDYMSRHQVQADGAKRESDNWQKGIDLASYKKSFLRHALELWGLWRGTVSRRLQKEYPGKSRDFLFRETACATLFNLQGLIHEYLKSDRLAEPAGPAQPTQLDAFREEMAKLQLIREAQERLKPRPFNPWYDKPNPWGINSAEMPKGLVYQNPYPVSDTPPWTNKP